MKSTLQTGCRWLAVYLLSLAGTLYLAENLQGLRLLADPVGDPNPTSTQIGGPPGPPVLCPNPCREEWILVSELIDGDECDHGPELDPICPPLNDPNNPFNPYLECFELNQGQASSTGLPCYCFKCGLPNSQGCESQLLMFVAHCGLGTQFEKVCPRNGEDTFAYRKKRLMITSPPGSPCNHEGGDFWVTFCGFPANTFAFACRTQNCVPLGLEFEDELTGRVKRCNNIPGEPLPTSPYLPRP